MNKAKQQGFSLIELLLVVLAIGILATIAWNNYGPQRIKQKRSDGIQALLRAAAEMEACRTQTLPHSYLNCVPAEAQSRKAYYQITLSEISTNSFTLTATPDPNDDALVADGDFTLNHLGQKGGSAPWPH